MLIRFRYVKFKPFNRIGHRKKVIVQRKKQNRTPKPNIISMFGSKVMKGDVIENKDCVFNASVKGYSELRDLNIRIKGTQGVVNAKKERANSYVRCIFNALCSLHAIM